MTKSTFQSRVRAIATKAAKTTTKTSTTGTITVTVAFPATEINSLAGQLYDEVTATAPAPAPQPTPTPTPPAPTPPSPTPPTPTPPAPQPAATSLYRAPQQVDQYVAQYPELKRIADQPTAVWLGEWSSPVEETVRKHADAAKAKGQMPIFAVYMIPGRDMGGFSAGGAKDPASYRAWIDSMARGLTTPAIIVLEPDAIVHDASPERLALIAYALDKLAPTGSKVYVDAGHPRWHTAEEMANRLKLLTLTAPSEGFALNTSNFVTTDMCRQYGDKISSLLGGAHYVIDTSRNGNPTMPEPWDWANPANRWLGPNPTTATGHPLCDAYLYVKAPGESDGWSQLVNKPAGQFDVDYALGLVRNTPSGA